MHGHDLTRGGLLARNVALNLAGWALPAVAALIAVPLLVRGLGDARFGVLALAWTALGYFSIVDLGMGRAVTHAVAERTGQGRESETGRVVRASLAVLVPLGVVAAAAMALATGWLTRDVLEIPAALLTETQAGFRVLAIALPFVGIAAALRGVLEATQRFGAVNAVRVPFGVVTFLGPVAALPFSRSVVPAIVILTLSRIALAIAYFAICARAIPGLASSAAGRADIRPLLRFGGWMTVSNVVSPLMHTFDRFVVAAALGIGTVTYYAAPNELVTKLWLFTAAIHPVFFSAIANTGARDGGRSVVLYDRMLRITLAGVFLPALLLVLLAPDVLRVWLGPAFVLNSTAVMQVLAIAVFVNTLGQGGMTFIHALGRPDVTGMYHLAQLPLYVGALWYLLPRFGLIGVAIAWAGRAIVDAWLLMLTAPALLPAARGTTFRMLSSTVASLVVLAAAAMLSESASRFIVATLAVPAWMLIVWRWLLTPEERAFPKRLLTASWRPLRP